MTRDYGMINWTKLNVSLYRSTLDTACSRSNISTVRYGVCWRNCAAFGPSKVPFPCEQRQPVINHSANTEPCRETILSRIRLLSRCASSLRLWWKSILKILNSNDRVTKEKYSSYLDRGEPNCARDPDSTWHRFHPRCYQQEGGSSRSRGRVERDLVPPAVQSLPPWRRTYHSAKLWFRSNCRSCNKERTWGNEF